MPLKQGDITIGICVLIFYILHISLLCYVVIAMN